LTTALAAVGCFVMKSTPFIFWALALLGGCTSEPNLSQDKTGAELPDARLGEPAPLSTDLSFLSEGLVAYYPFDGNASDQSGHDHNTTVHGAFLSADRHGAPHKAYSFDGVDDYMLVKDEAALRSSYLSIACWACPASFGIQMILGKTNYGNAQGEQYGLSLTELTPTLAIKRNSGGALGVGWNQVNASSPIPLNQWTHLAATWNGTALKMYLDGRLHKQNTEVPVGPIDNLAGGNLQIGRWWSGFPEQYLGKIDEIRIYDRALSAAEVAALHQFEK
jgi:hypothetical protein